MELRVGVRMLRRERAMMRRVSAALLQARVSSSPQSWPWASLDCNARDDRIASVNRSLVPAVAGRLRIDAHVLLQRRNQVRHHLQGDHDLGADGRADNVIRFGRMDVLLREWQDFAEGEGEVERRVRDGAEIRVGARKIGCFVRDDGEIDLFLCQTWQPKITASLSAPLIPSHDTDDDALHLHLVGAARIGCIAGFAGCRRMCPFSR